jgi:uncharacterized protein (DUF302 family)
MVDDGRRVVIDLPFEAAVGATTAAIHREGWTILARVDVREQFKTELQHGFRQYELLEAWHPETAFEEIRRDLDAGARAPMRFAVYELADGETAVTVDDRSDRAQRILGRLRLLPRAAVVTPAA